MGKYINADPTNVKKPKKVQEKAQNEFKTIKYEAEKGIKRKLANIVNIPNKKQKLLSNSNVETEASEAWSNFNEIQFDEINNTNDLFYVDEVKNNYENITNKDVLFHIIDEVSLEGLDGITIEALWKRLDRCLISSSFLNDHIKELIWRLLCNNNHIHFFVLQQPRGILEICDRFKNIDPDKGDIIEADKPAKEIYPLAQVSEKDIIGSCSTFNSRVEIQDVRNLSFKQAWQKYKTQLVIVADQKTRFKSIFDEFSDPNIELMPLEYCVLEKLGRSRELGDITNSTLGSFLNLDAKSTFHYQKHLLQHHLVSKQQIFIQDCGSEMGKSVMLLQLRRFYNRIKSKRLIIAEQVVKLLKTSPNLRMQYSELKRLLPKINPVILTKTLKSNDLKKYVNTDIICLYRDMYPDSTESEWKCKTNQKEKCIRILELKDRTVNVLATWDNKDDEESDEDDGKGWTEGRVSFNVEFFQDVYNYILSKGEDGVSQMEIQRIYDVDFYTARTIIRKLSARNVIDCKRVHEGKQRTFKFFARCLYDTESEKIFDVEPVERNTAIVAKILHKQKQAVDKIAINSPQREIQEDEISCTFVEHLQFCMFKYKEFLNEINQTKSVQNIKSRACFEKERKLFLLNITIYDYIKIQQNCNINELLNNLKTNIKTVKPNINNVCTSKFKDDKITKFLLLRAMFNEIVINDPASLNFIENARPLKRKHSIDVPKDIKPARPLKHPVYLGTNPQQVFLDVDDNIRTEILVSAPPKKFFTHTKIYRTNNREITERVIKRINIILEVLNEMKIMEAHKMLRIVEQKEQADGYNKKIDRKSLLRIYSLLVNEGYIKFYKICISNNIIERSQILLCHPLIDYKDSTVSATIQQIKLRYFIGNEKEEKVIKEEVPSTSSQPDLPDINASIVEMKKLTSENEITLKYDKNAGKTYGFRPKFQRMRILHEFLQYLIYLLPSKTEKLNHKQVKRLFEEYKINLNENDLEEMPGIYSKEISWKTFIPPLPVHKGWTNGWALICDIILRLPLSVFVKIHNVSFAVPELKEFLAHPVKRYFLIKNLPLKIRAPLLHKQRYFTQLQETFTRLAYIGLLQYGPEKYKDKNQMFIYLNRYASLLDTTSSEPAYHKTSIKEYPCIRFTFDTQNDVENYWYNLYTISMNTRLNARNVMAGQTIILTDVSANASLLASVKSRTVEEVFEHDNGNIPGDNRGACGLDSSLWVHITRNWMWASPNKKPLQTNFGLKNDKFVNVIKQVVSYDEIQKKSNVTTHASNKIVANKLDKRRIQPSKTSKKNQKIYRKMIPRVTKKREYYDHVDKVLRKKLNKLKVPWDEKEDKLLFLAKAVSMFVCPKTPRKQLIPYTVIRDVLHRLYPKSRNKTSKAIQRRLFSLIQSDSAMKIIENNYMQLIKIDVIKKYFSNLIFQVNREDDERIKVTEQELITAFVYIMSYVSQHSNDVQMLLLGKITNYDYISNTNIENLDFIETDTNIVRYQDAVNETDVRKDVIKSIIHSSLENNSKNTRWAFQLFRIYQNFPDTLIREVVNEMKNQQIISMKKLSTESSKKRIHTPFYLSNTYLFSLATTFSETTAINAYETFNLFNTNHGLLDIDLSFDAVERRKYGQLLAVNELYTIYSQIIFEFDIPDTALVLNPNIEDHSDLVHELSIRWQSHLTKQLEERTIVETKLVKIETKDTNSKETDTPLDLTTDGSAETIDKLKSWVSDCMLSDRRSPSPEFLNFDENDKVVEEQSDENDLVIENKVEIRKSVPSLDEIKEAMLTNDSEQVPYITDLFDILSKDSYRDGIEETDKDERFESLKKHFINVYPQASACKTKKFDDFSHNSVVEYLNNKIEKSKLYEKILNSNFVQTSTIDLLEQINQLGGNQIDFNIANNILDFVRNKGICGASAFDLKTNFNESSMNLKLHTIIECLQRNGLLLRVGICSIFFVHIDFQTHWLIKTFALSQEEENLLNRTSVDKYNEAKSTIEERLSGAQSLYVKIRPWNRVDGSLNKDLLFKWLCIILSHCLDVPKIPLINLFNKFCYIKPTDVFHLLEILNDLNCVKLFVYENSDNFLTTDWCLTNERPATFLDHFNDIYVEPTNIAMVSIGAFFYEM